jgi:hypothetical protein
MVRNADSSQNSLALPELRVEGSCIAIFLILDMGAGDYNWFQKSLR